MEYDLLLVKDRLKKDGSDILNEFGKNLESSQSPYLV